jgi:NAD-dependent SIR2 family protein deacetylase
MTLPLTRWDRNIDGLESRAGLSYGLGNSVPPTSPSKSKSKSAPTPSPSPSPRKTAASLVPRCIPLHGHLATLSCPSCSLTLPLPPYVPLLASGTSPACPRCLENEQARAILGERSRGVGRMKPDVVLYGEPHKEGERVGEILRKDLGGKRPDLLIVVGTSLKVPGTRMLVREMGKVIRPSPVDGEDEEDEDDDAYEMPPASGSTSLSSQPSSQQARGSKKFKAKKQIHTIYLNFDFPTPAKEFQSTFDVWARGDVQEFVQAVEEEREAQEEKKESRRLEKLRASERKVQRERVKVEKERKVEEGKGKGKEEERISPSKAFPRAATAINRSSPPKLVYAANSPPSLPKSAIQTRRTSSLSPTPPALPPVGPFTRALPSPSPAPSIPLPLVDPTPSQRHNLAKLASPHVSISPEPRQRPLSQTRSRSPVTLPSIRRTRSSISPSDSSTTERPAKRSRRSSVDPPTTTNTPTPTLEPRRTRSSISPASSDLSDARSSSPAIYTSNEKRFSVDVEVKKKVVVRGGKLGFRVGKPGVEGSRYKK